MNGKKWTDKEKVKAIPMEKFLATINVLPLKQDHFGYWYLSPLRTEKTASFKVNPKLNTWYDFGLEQGGNIIDFVMVKWNKSFYEALHFLDGNSYSNMALSHSLPEKKGNKIKEVIRIEKEVKNYMLVEYLNQRGIDRNKIKGLVGEIYYMLENNPKTYYGLSFKNDKGGFEIRNKYFKGGIGKKYFTLLEKGFDSITVFEGFIDFLSLQCHRLIKSDILVLNSCVNTVKAIPIIQKYNKAYLMLDNDGTGNHHTQMIQDYVKSARDLRYLYKNDKDLNEWMLNNYTLNILDVNK